MSINPEETELTSKSNDFAKAMGSFVQTDFQYFDYLRNRQRYYIGTKHVSTTSNVTPAKKLVEKPKGTDDGSGLPLRRWRRKRRKSRRQPEYATVPAWATQLAFANANAKDYLENNAVNDRPGWDELLDRALPGPTSPIPELSTQQYKDRSTIEFSDDVLPDVSGPSIIDELIKNQNQKDVYRGVESDNEKYGNTYPDGFSGYSERPEVNTDKNSSSGWEMNPNIDLNLLLKTFQFGKGIFDLGKFLFSDPLQGYATGGYVRSATPALIGEAGPELVIPVAKFGEAIEAMYREGASVMIASTIGFLNKLPNSSARAGVMAEANSLASIFGISEVASIEGNFGLTKSLVPFEGTGGATTVINASLGTPEKQNTRGGGGLLGALNMGRKLLKKTKIGKKVGKVARRSKTVAKGLLKKAGRKIGVKSVAKIGGKALGKGLLKKIPFVGLGAGLLFAGQRMMAGDFKGAGLEMLSGVAGTVPGIGTAVSIGLDAALAAKDVGMIGDGKPEASTPNPSVAGNGMPIILNPSTMKAWERAVAAAAKDGVNLPMSVTSSYRSAKQQQELIDRAAAGDPNVMTPAPVGLSPHGQGWAVDINYYSKANEWMRENGSKYGFKWQGEKDPVHFDFWNNEPNDKWLQPGNRDWIPNNIAAPEKKNSSQITNPSINQPNVSSAKKILAQEPVKQSEKNLGMGNTIAQMPVPVPIPTPMPYPVPTEVNKDSKDYVVIDVFGKGSKREVVS